LTPLLFIGERGRRPLVPSTEVAAAAEAAFVPAKVIKPVTESILPLSERGSWAPPLEERGAGVSFSFRPLGVWRFAVEPGIYSSAKEAGGLFVPSTEVAAAAEAAFVPAGH
jgi:hypothetical protein